MISEAKEKVNTSYGTKFSAKQHIYSSFALCYNGLPNKKLLNIKERRYSMSIAKVNGINIDYSIRGQGEPLVMIMGFAAGQSAWMRQVSVFQKQFKIITFDNRGVGKSDKPQGPYSPRIMAEDTVQLMNYLKINQAHIMGVSMGGLIAQEIAINYPDRVRKLILGSTWSSQDNGADGITQSMLDILKLPVQQLVPLQLDACMDKPLNRLIILPLMKFKFRRLKNPEAIGIAGQVDCISNYNSRERLSFIKAPTLVITGTKDRVVKHTSSETLAHKIPKARLVKVENGSHLCFVEVSKIFNKEVLDFLKSA
jgi:pimeloyl-ACP methyl ester carboxylesterase